MLCPVKSLCAPHCLSTCMLRPIRRVTNVVTRAEAHPGPEQTSPPAAPPAKEQVIVPFGQLLTSTVVKQYKQLVDSGMSGEAAIACMENTEYVVGGRMGELKEEIKKLEGKVDSEVGEVKSKVDSIQMQLYALTALVVLGLTLINVDTLPSTIIGTIIRKLLG